MFWIDSFSANCIESIEESSSGVYDAVVSELLENFEYFNRDLTSKGNSNFFK